MQVFFINPIQAAGPASLSVNPDAKSVQVGTPFSVDIVVDGGGNPIIVAEAKVTVSQNLTIEEITLGNCYFAFIKTPTTSDPSFIGGIPGGSSNKCTIYSMKLQPTSAGNGTVTISNGAVKSSVDASELLGSYQNGNYVVTNSNSANVNVTSLPPVVADQNQNTQIQTTQSNLDSYTLNLSVVDKDGKAGGGNLVILYTADGTLITTTKTNNKGEVQIPNVKAGTYNVVVADGDTKIAEQVVTVNGSNPTMKFTVRGTISASNPTTANHAVRNLILSASVLLILAATIVGAFLFLKRRKNKQQPPTTDQTPPVPPQTVPQM